MASPLDLSPVGLGISATSDLFKSIYGIYQMIHGNAGLKNLQHPDYKPDQNILNNQQLAGQIASQGIPDSARNFYSQGIDRGLGSSISATLQGGGGLGYINNAFANANDAYGNLMAKDAMQKLQNQQLLMGANSAVADENKLAFNWNSVVPYEQKFNQFTNQANSGAENIFGGLKGIGTSFAGSGGFGNKQMNGMDTTNNSSSSSNDWYNQLLKQMSDSKLNLQSPQLFTPSFSNNLFGG